MTHVLIAEDLEESRYLLQALLEGNGYRVTAAANGVEALAAARRERPDIIVSDALMPKMDGFALCRAWMQDETLKAIPFVFYSATYTEPEDEKFALALGAVRYLIKPQEPEAFVGELQRVLGEWRARPAPAPASLLDEESFRALHDAALARKLEHKITQLEAADRRLRESERKYRQLFEDNPQPMWVYDLKTLEFLAVNDAMVAHYGYSRSELLAMTISDIRPPEEIPRLLESIAAVLSEDKPVSGIWRHRKKDGTLVDMEMTTHRIEFDGRGANMALAHDVTARLRMERELADSEDRFRALVEQSLVGIYLTDGEKIIYANPRAAEIFGYAQHEINDLPVRALVTEEDWPMVENRIRRRLSGAEMAGSYEYRGRRKNGGVVIVGINATTARVGDRDVIIVVIQDITARKALEEQLRHSQKMEFMGQLTGGLAHDFNNLLAIVIGNLDLLALDLDESHAARRGLDAALAAALRGAALSKRLLAFARREPLAPRSLELNARIAECLPLLRDALGPAVELRTGLDGNLVVEVDPGELETALVNLAVNAHDAMPQGGLFAIETRAASLDGVGACVAAAGTLPAGDYALLAIADNGCGMSEAVRQRALEPFFTTKARGKGTGLGLAMVYGFAQRSGGALQLDSREGQGTTIKIFLPISQQAAAADTATKAAVVGGEESILLVDDETELLAPVRLLLTRLGYRVATAAGAEDALAWLEQGEPVDLLLTDVVMPGTNGVRLAERACAMRPGLRVLFASAHTGEALFEHIGGTPRFPVLDKPYRRFELALAVRRALDAAATEVK